MLFEEDRRATYMLPLSTYHLPEDEYNKLDMLMNYPNPYGVHSAIYNSGVVILIDKTSGLTFLLKEQFPVLFNIAHKAKEAEIYFIDFYERTLPRDDLKLYKWED